MPSTGSPSDRPDPVWCQGDRATPPLLPLEIRVCQHKTCRKDGSAKVFQAFVAQSSPQLQVLPAGCMGNCGNGPMVTVLPAQVSYSHVRSRDVAAIVAQHLPPQPGRSPDHPALPQELPPPKRHNDNSPQPPSPTAGFWPYVALGLALLIALGSILGTVLSLG